MIASGYTMDLYCRHKDTGTVKHEFDEFPHSFLGETWGECKRQALDRGWSFQRDGDVTCPRCSKKKPKPRPAESGRWVSIFDLAAERQGGGDA